MRPSLIAESEICTCGDANNGASPFWGFGSRNIVREGDTLFACLWETSSSVKPLCNTRWRLFRRRDGDENWTLAQAAPACNEREPCLLVRLPGKRLALSVNPGTRQSGTLADGRLAWHTDPHLLLFDVKHPERAPERRSPQWDRAYTFSEHSYRAFAADRDGNTFLTQQVELAGDYHQAWTYADASGSTLAAGVLRFPMRGCYAQIAVRGKAVWAMAISDEIEPVPEWREHKRTVTGQEWDYEFRQLFFTWTPDVTALPFSPPLTVASRDETCGLIRNLDLWLDPQGDAHLLFVERNIWHTYIRDRFFPGTPITVALKYAILHNGRIVHRATLAEAAEEFGAASAPAAKPFGMPDLVFRGPHTNWAMFHALSGGRLAAIWHQAEGTDAANCVQVLWPEPGSPQRLPLAQPLSTFFPVSERAGGEPSDVMDLCGCAVAPTSIRHAQIRLA